MSPIFTDICAWILLVLEFVVFLLMLSFFIFGGKVTVSVQLKGPLRFMSTQQKESE